MADRTLNGTDLLRVLLSAGGLSVDGAGGRGLLALIEAKQE